MIGYLYTITDSKGNTIVLNDMSVPSRIIALQEYPDFSVDVKNSEIDRQGQHGVADFFSYYGKRSTTFSGVIVGDTEGDVEAVKENLTAILGLPLYPYAGNEGIVTVKWTDSMGFSWQIEGKLARDIRFNRNLNQQYKLTFTFSIKSPDPFIVSQNVSSMVGTRGYAISGSGFPMEMPDLLGITKVNTMVVHNEGAVEAHTKIRIYGEDTVVTNPIIENITTGKWFQLNTTIDTALQYIEIDSKLGTVVDELGNDLTGLIEAGSEFVVLARGDNQIAYTSDENPLITFVQPSAQFTVSYRNTKI